MILWKNLTDLEYFVLKQKMLQNDWKRFWTQILKVAHAFYRPLLIKTQLLSSKKSSILLGFTLKTFSSDFVKKLVRSWVPHFEAKNTSKCVKMLLSPNLRIAHAITELFIDNDFYRPLLIKTQLIGSKRAGTLLGFILKTFCRSDFLKKVDRTWVFRF